MTTRIIGRSMWEGEREDEGHRVFTVKHKIASNDKNDGPSVVMFTPGLPAIGSAYAFGNDLDSWAFCYPTMKIKYAPEIKEGHWGLFWTTEQKFSTKPLRRCQDTTIEDPLQEPMKISGSFVKYTEEARQDRFGNFLLTSSLEPLRGPQVEFDSNRPSVRIEQNVMTLDLPTFTSMVDCVNDSPLWGLAARCIKLSSPTWERKLYGVCSYYYTRIFEFDVNFNTFDRTVPDLGTKILHGKWNETTGAYTVTDVATGVTASRFNPQHFQKYTDYAGNPTSVLLDGFGLPANTIVFSGTGSSTSGSPAEINIEKYNGANFLLLNIPTSL